LDLILTGRPVGAAEALNIGLVNRVVAKGEARQAAEELARELAHFPQVCMRGDRMSAYEQFDVSFEEGMSNEFNHGLKALSEETSAGAKKFVGGAGRHGNFGEN
jgi:enoyl-CoA hydratase/carnithine racemase